MYFGSSDMEMASSMVSPKLRGGSQVFAYPNPFFDLAHTYLPTTIKSLLRWCRYYMLTHPVINAATFAMAEYPVTDLILEHEDRDVVRMWSEFFLSKNYHQYQIEQNVDFFGYGNNFSSIYYTPTKFLKCQNCKFEEQALHILSSWVFTGTEFRLTCPKCGHSDTALARDMHFKNAAGIRFLRWNPEDVDLTYNDITGGYEFYYNIPGPVRNDIQLGKKSVVAAIPQVFIQAIKERKAIKFNNAHIFHMRRPAPSGMDRGWGTPLIMPVLKSAFYDQIMRKGQEAVILERIVPLNVMFPQSGSGTADVYSSVNLVDWRDQFAREILRWRRDRNYIPLSPIPIGNQTIGGDGRALLLNPELQENSEKILAGMGCPRELIYGGMSYSGSNVSLRVLENKFINNTSRRLAFTKWVIQEVAAFMNWPVVTPKYKPFKMADDLQRKAYRMQQNQAGILSATTLLSEDDNDFFNEVDLQEKELAKKMEVQEKTQLAMAEVQGKQQIIAAKYAVKAQKVQTDAQQLPAAQGEPGGPENAQGNGAPGGQPGETPMAQAPQEQVSAEQLPGPMQATQSPLSMGVKGQGSVGVTLSTAYAEAQRISAMPPDQQTSALAMLAQQNPDLAQLVQGLLSKMGGQAQPANPVDMRPLPEKLPPRRQTSTI